MLFDILEHNSFSGFVQIDEKCVKKFVKKISNKSVEFSTKILYNDFGMLRAALRLIPELLLEKAQGLS